jgi:hypothetical protein
MEKGGLGVIFLAACRPAGYSRTDNSVPLPPAFFQNKDIE